MLCIQFDYFFFILSALFSFFLIKMKDIVADSLSDKGCCVHPEQTFDDENSCIADITTSVVTYLLIF